MIEVRVNRKAAARAASVATLFEHPLHSEVSQPRASGSGRQELFAVHIGY